MATAIPPAVVIIAAGRSRGGWAAGTRRKTVRARGLAGEVLCELGEPDPGHREQTGCPDHDGHR
jgi:hypothetical protein